MTLPAHPGPPGSSSAKEVVVTFSTGAEVRGHVLALNTEKPTFRLNTVDLQGQAATQEIRFEDIKMVALLRVPGAPDNAFAPTARVVTIRFMDGQVIRGVTLDYAGARTGLYLAPLRGERVERAYIPLTAVREVLSIHRLGELLLEQGAVTVAQVEQAVRRQEEAKTEQLGEILLRHKAITTQQLSQSLSLQKQYSGTKKLGEILLQQGFVDQTQIDEALEVQQGQRRKKFGEILVEMGFATHKTIAIALAMQCNVPFLDLATQAIHPDLANLVPAPFARRNQIMPVSVQQGILTVAVTDPLDNPAVDELRSTSGHTIIMVIATPQDIARCINAFYGKPARPGA